MTPQQQAVFMAMVVRGDVVGQDDTQNAVIAAIRASDQFIEANRDTADQLFAQMQAVRSAVEDANRRIVTGMALLAMLADATTIASIDAEIAALQQPQPQE